MIGLALDYYGMDGNQVLAQHGVNIIERASADSRVPALNCQHVWQHGMENGADDALGIVFAKSFRPGLLGGLSFSLVTSPTLYHSIQRLRKYFKVISVVGDIVVTEVNDELQLQLTMPIPFELTNPESVDGTIGLLLQLLRLAGSDSLTPKLVYLPRKDPVNLEKFQTFFGKQIVFNSDKTAIVFDRSTLDAPLASANAAVAQANDRAIMDYLNRFVENNIAGKVSTVLLEMMPKGEASIGTVAAKLNMGERKLQRLLASEEISFSELIDEARISLATTYLKQSWRSIGEISSLLGYTEPANFTRSFKRLCGISPAEFRERFKGSR